MNHLPTFVIDGPEDEDWIKVVTRMRDGRPMPIDKNLGWAPGPDAHWARVGESTKLGGPMAKELLKDAISRHGFTYSVTDRAERVVGKSVSIYPEREKPFPGVGSLSRADLQAYVKANADLLEQKGNCFGTWVSEETGTVFLDVAVVVASHAKARTLARQYNQDAYFDLGTKKEIQVKPKRLLR